MKKNKTILVIVAIAFTAISFFLVINILLNESLNRSILLVLFFSFGIYGSITTVFACINPIIKTHELMGSNFYSISNERLWISLYRVLGVALFKKGILLFYWGKKENRTKYFNGRQGGLLAFLDNSQKAEFGHIESFVVMLLLSLIFGIKDHVQYAITILILDVFGNIYPILLQRYNRNIVFKLLSKNQINKDNINV
jgi:hypothetical protein